MKRILLSDYVVRGGTLILGLPELQRTFDNIKSGGGLVLDVSSDPRIGISEIILLDNERIQQLMHDLNLDEIEKSKLN